MRNDEFIKLSERMLKRNQGRLDKINLEHIGNEQNLTYHGGFDKGYLVGKTSMLDDIIEELKAIENKEVK